MRVIAKPTMHFFRSRDGVDKAIMQQRLIKS